MRISVSYSVPVQVIVDLDTGRVDRVVVIDESVEQDPSGYIADADSYEAINNPQRTDVIRAYEIAERAVWPGWNFGW